MQIDARLRTPGSCETINTIVTDRRPKRKRTTLRDVAELTGLSPAGVSYALRGQRVSAATEVRVRDAADRLGFRSDPIARALRGGSTGVIGVIGGSLADYWHQEFASELQRHLRRRGRHMLLADADGDAATEADLARGLVDQRVDGLIALPVAPDSPAWTEIVSQVPVVAVGAPLPAPAGAIRFQAQEGADLVLDHLRSLGHERIRVLSTGVHRPRRRVRGADNDVRVRGGRRPGRDRRRAARPVTADGGLRALRRPRLRRLHGLRRAWGGASPRTSRWPGSTTTRSRGCSARR